MPAERKFATGLPMSQGFPRSPAKRIGIALAAVTILIALGTTGYIVIERMSLLDALYMTVITISTVGYDEVKPLDAHGKIFTIMLIVLGMGTAFYLFATITEVILEGELGDYLGARGMHRKIRELENHVIICGFGRFGRAVADELAHHRVPMVVIDPSAQSAEELDRLSIPYLVGDAMRDEVLEEAGIRVARALVAATASDADNVYITLSAREKNPRLSIHARGEGEVGLRRLKLAGADQVISAYQYGGYRVASTIVRPSVVDFIELFTSGRGEEVDLEEIRIPADSAMVGKSVVEIEHSLGKLRIVALKRDDEPIRIIPVADTRINAGDLLVAIGDRASLESLVNGRAT
ncbi:MAG TPA: potassium channel protein [Candidatus Binataceae bacterium]|nr:potassium channel protein [Candidatus Binataceae bacterium]